MLARRLPVEEVRDYLEEPRFRMVDDEIEGTANWATWSTQRTQTDDIDTMVFMLMSFAVLLIPITMYKPDVKSAFRRLPVAARHWIYSTIIYNHDGKVWSSTHKSCNLGAISSVWAWHRVSNVALAICRQVFKMAMGKFVDDTYGVSRKDVCWKQVHPAHHLCSFRFGLGPEKVR